MATPHIAGAIALLWAGRPELRHDISQSRTVLNQAAHFLAYEQCGTPGPPNNVAGWGRVDISAAIPAPGPRQCFLCFFPVVLGETFDGVTPPALPPDWIATNLQGPPPLWVTSNSGMPNPPADTQPNAAFIDDPAVISDKLLDSLTFTVFEAAALQVTFRHNFDLEASDEDSSLGFDGGVLEISVDQGQTYHDVLDAGGSFVVGGYNRRISKDRGSPLADRLAWSGNSRGFITTTVNLPSEVIEGRLRWRMASDISGSRAGWRVDTVNISWCQLPGALCSPTPTATATPTPTASPSPTATAIARPTRSPRPTPSPAPRPKP